MVAAVPTVKAGTTTLTKDTDYTVTYASNTNVGTATITITGKGNYTGTKTVTFAITAADISSATVSGVKNSYTYTGKEIKPAPVVKSGSITLTKDTDYTLAYNSNKTVGKATVTITGKGNYTGTKSVTFKIAQAKGKITAKNKTVKYSK